MNRLVIDCSVTMGWCFADESGEFAEAVLAAVHTDGAVVPPIWKWEVGNSLLMAERRGRITPDDCRLILAKLATLPIAVDDGSAPAAWHETLNLARDHRLTVYDAAYLELAIRDSSRLCTLDQELIAAAKRLGVVLYTTTMT